MRHRLTDFDLAVLAAARMGSLTAVWGWHGGSRRRRRGIISWLMSDVNVMPSLFRLAQAGELVITDDKRLLFTDTKEYADYVTLQQNLRDFKKAIHTGEIKLPRLPRPKKGA